MTRLTREQILAAAKRTDTTGWPADGTHTVRTYWLSFVDPDRAEGHRFLGVSIVEVTEAAAARMRPKLPPQALPGAEWIAEAARTAWVHGCNPGGEMAAHELPAPPPAEWLYRLLTKKETDALNTLMRNR